MKTRILIAALLGATSLLVTVPASAGSAADRAVDRPAHDPVVDRPTDDAPRIVRRCLRRYEQGEHLSPRCRRVLCRWFHHRPADRCRHRCPTDHLPTDRVTTDHRPVDRVHCRPRPSDRPIDRVSD